MIQHEPSVVEYRFKEIVIWEEIVINYFTKGRLKIKIETW